MARKGKNKLKTSTRPEEKRILGFRRFDQLFLIVCEDENTEPTYFRQFSDLLPDLPESTLFVRCVGTGLDPFGVVQRAVKERNLLAREAKREVDYTWAVFDKDDADENEAIFEVWLLLHLTDLSSASPIPRATIYEQLQIKIRELGTETPTSSRRSKHWATKPPLRNALKP